MATSTTTEEFRNKELLDRVRSLLQRDKIRLWEPPYTDANTGAENILEVWLLYFVRSLSKLYINIGLNSKFVCRTWQ